MSALLGTLTISLAVAVVLLLGFILWRERRSAALTRAAGQLEGIVRSGRFAERIRVNGPAAEFAESANRLLEQMAMKDLMIGERERSLVGLLAGLQEAVAVHRDHIVFANQRFAALTGSPSAEQLTGKTIADLLHPDYTELVTEHLRRSLAGEPGLERLEIELHPDEDGGTARVELSAVRIDYQGGPALLLTLVEMGPRSMPVAAVARGRPTAWETLDSLGEGIITTDVSGRIDYVNQAGEQLMGVTAVDALGKSITDIIQLLDESDRRSLGDPVRHCLATQSKVTAGRRGLMISRSGNEERSVELTVTPLKGQKGDLVGTVVVVRDVSELRGITKQMSYQASHDALTGLVNRREFERRLEEALQTAHTNEGKHVLCYLDLDRFKAVNDTCGHMAGDGMLREVAALIKETVRDSDTVGRLGGDEFGLLLVGCPLDKARQIADDVVRKISDYRFVWKDKIFNIGISVGLIEISRESGAPDEVMSAADSACYVAKKQGNHVHVYSARDEAVARHRGEIQWLQRLQSALKDNRFELMAQPIIASAATDTGPALEVLLRLQDDNVPGGISPAEFLRAAERYRLMSDVDRWVVQTALTALGRGGIRLPSSRSLSINLSGQTLGDPQFLEFVVDVLDRTGVSPNQLCFEVTENSVITNIEHAQRFIGVLHGMGCQFALDDFGRGLSSFGNLKNLSLDYLKIDGTFIRNLAVDSVNQAMVAAMIKLARTLNFRVIAEQVEDAGALDAAKKMGVDFLQGFYLGRPQPLARVVPARSIV
ncbi:MAG TPA: EAL domain-containing protein [Steroidobacter sp.]|uniref:EAL domain-containing protein n=1 Tax=Steroidobacter sp. TaxID=1978227 RepID=UPI002ED8DCA4